MCYCKFLFAPLARLEPGSSGWVPGLPGWPLVVVSREWAVRDDLKLAKHFESRRKIHAGKHYNSRDSIFLICLYNHFPAAYIDIMSI